MAKKLNQPAQPAQPARQQTPALTYLMKLIGQFPDAPALTLAKRAYREHPELWTDLEGARTAIRRLLGNHGNKDRNRGVKDKEFFRESRTAGASLPCVPEALERPLWGAVQIDGPARCLILSDLHIPYHDPQALQVALDYGVQHKATMVLLNGDICDHFALSRWEKDPRERDFPGEVAKTRQFLIGLSEMFPKARVLYKTGNHEERYENYLRMKAPELLGVANFEWSEVFGVDKANLVDGKRPVKIGQLNVIHGHEYVFNISNPVNPARGMFLRAKTHVLGGHFHQTSQHSAKSLEGKVVSAWSTGALCDMNPEYRPLNDWNHGFAFVEIGRDGSFHVDNLRIIAGKVF